MYINYYFTIENIRGIYNKEVKRF